MTRFLVILFIATLPWISGCQKAGCPAYITADGRKVAVCKPVKNFSNKRMKAKYARKTKTVKIGNPGWGKQSNNYKPRKSTSKIANPNWGKQSKNYKPRTSSATSFRDFSIRIKRKGSSNSASATANFTVRIKKKKKSKNNFSARLWPRRNKSRASRQASSDKQSFGLFSKEMKKDLNLK